MILENDSPQIPNLIKGHSALSKTTDLLIATKDINFNFKLSTLPLD